MKIAVIGGGASGLAAAIAAKTKGADVFLFEKNNSLGKKILVTGNGKCNLTNLNLSEKMYYSSDRSLIMPLMRKFSYLRTISFFEGLGVLLKDKNGGIYPYSEQASTVLDALINEVEFLKVNVYTGITVKDIVCVDGKYRFSVLDAAKPDMPKHDFDDAFDRVILASGGKAAPKTGSDGFGYYISEKLGHTVNPTFPALVGIKCEGDWKNISGVRAHAAVAVLSGDNILGEDVGEVQFTEYGLSGIPVFQISRIVAEQLALGNNISISVDLMPEFDMDEYLKELIIRNLVLYNRTCGQFFKGILNSKIAEFLIEKMGKSVDEPLQDDYLKEFASISKDFRVKPVGVNDFDQAQVTAGGVSLIEITDRFESKICPGLYFAGEVLDVDGKCGGYNLQWAWASGYLAGEAAADAET